MNAITNILQVHSVDELICYFATNLGWNIDLESFESVEDFSYEFTAEDLCLNAGAFAKIRSLRQLRPFDVNQKWGMFCLNIESRGFSVSALRNVLAGLVSRKQNNPTAPVWKLHNLLFLCEWGDSENRWIGLVHFVAQEHGSPLIQAITCATGGRMVARKALQIFAERLSQLAWPDNTGDAQAWLEAWSGAFDKGYVKEVVDILGECPYVSFETLCKKMLGIPGQCTAQKNTLRQQLEEESKCPDSMIGIVPAAEAKKAVINEGTVYSPAWAAKRSKELGCTGPAETIGLDLYAKMQENGWWYQCNMPDFEAMEQANCNHIIAEEWVLGVLNQFGLKFQQKWQMPWEKLQLKNKQIAEAEHYDEQSVLHGYESYRKGMDLLQCQAAMLLPGTPEWTSTMEAAVEHLQQSEREGCPLAKFQLGKMCKQKKPERSDAYFKGAVPGLKLLAAKGSKEAIACLSQLGIVGYKECASAADKGSGELTKGSLIRDWCGESDFPPLIWKAMKREQVITVGQFLVFSQESHLASISGVGEKTIAICQKVRNLFLKNIK